MFSSGIFQKASLCHIKGTIPFIQTHSMDNFCGKGRGKKHPTPYLWIEKRQFYRDFYSVGWWINGIMKWKHFLCLFFQLCITFFCWNNLYKFPLRHTEWFKKMDSTSVEYTSQPIHYMEMTNTSFKRCSKVLNASTRVLINFPFFTATAIVNTMPIMHHKTFVNRKKTWFFFF